MSEITTREDLRPDPGEDSWRAAAAARRAADRSRVKESVVILDFGSQYSLLIARRVRECGVYCELLPHDAPLDTVADLNPKGFILSGGPAGVYEDDAPMAPAYVFESELPILGICYGMQLMARMRSGVLDTHLPSQHRGVDCHTLPPEARHPIRIEPDSRLACILGSETCEVNSLHQQAVHRVGSMHRTVATSSDGVIEAIERSGASAGPWEIGVQWHPEKMAEESSQRLFRAFVHACRESDDEL